MDLSYYLRVFLRRLHYVLLFLVLGGGIGGALAVLLPTVYRAEARLVVESEQIPGNLAESTVQVEPTEQLEIIRQRILTRETLIDMANRLGIYAAGQEGQRLAADEIVDDLRSRIGIVTTGGAASRTGPVQATIVTVGFEAPTAQLASAVANEVVTLILQENVQMRTRTAGQTLDFFVQEVDRLDGELRTKGAAIQAFQEANRDSLPESLEFRRGQLVSAQERLQQMDRDEASLRDRRDRLVAIYEETGSVAAPLDQPRTPEERQLDDLRAQLAAALSVLAPTNPRVRLLQGQIDALAANVARQAGEAPSDASPGASAYDIQLADIDAQVGGLTAERDRVQADMEAVQSTINATPGNAIALDTLQRDYAALRAQYDLAVQNRSAAETGEQIEALSRGQRISIIEQAIPPRAPISPNRPLIAAAGVGGGLALGLGLVVLLELLNRSIRRPVEITRSLGIAPFAALPLVRSRRDVRRRRLTLAAAFAAVLIGIPGSLWLVHTRVMPLDVVLDRAMARLSTLT